MKRLSILATIILFGAVSLAYAAGATYLPQTAQTSCFDTFGATIGCAGTGQDGEFQAGAGWPAPRFTGSSPGILKDNLSGLMWVRDVSPLSTACGGGDNTAWSDAIDFVTCLNNNNHLGYNDWRLPNVNELATLINLGSDDPVNWLKTEGFNIGYSASGYKYWSSTTTPDLAQRALIGWLDQWAVTWLPYESAAQVWPVRLGPQDSVDPAYLFNVWKTGQTQSFHSFDDGYFKRGILWPSPRFSDGGNGTIHDNLTGLTWSRNSNAPGPAGCKTGTIMTWPEALAYAQCLNSNSYLGYSDWRIPNRWELGSLIDRSQDNPPLPAGHLFESVQPGEYWTSTTIETLPTSVWTINMNNCESCVGGNGAEETEEKPKPGTCGPCGEAPLPLPLQ